MDLSQDEADYLINLKKYYFDALTVEFPLQGEKLSIPLYSSDKKESFLLDVHRGRINLQKITYQNRTRNIVILVRLDIEGPPHRNPDGSEVSTPHIHIYREGFAHKWAFEIDVLKFRNCTDIRQTLIDFMDYCNIVDIPEIAFGLFL